MTVWNHQTPIFTVYKCRIWVVFCRSAQHSERLLTGKRIVIASRVHYGYRDHHSVPGPVLLRYRDDDEGTGMI